MLSVSTPSGSIAYRATGSGEAVVLLNGTGETSASFMPLAERLGARHRCVATDARDTGSSFYADAPYGPRELAADAASVIDQLELGSCHVVGYSLGGATAQELAIARPDLVRSLVLLSTWARSDAWFVTQMQNWQAIRRATDGDEHAFLRALAPWMYAPATLANDAEPWRMYDDLDEQPQRTIGWMRQCEADMAHDARDRLSEVEAPALVIVGEDDICTPPRFAHDLLDALPNARLVTVAETAHAALFERPDVVAAAIEDFFAEV